MFLLVVNQVLLERYYTPPPLTVGPQERVILRSSEIKVVPNCTPEGVLTAATLARLFFLTL